MENKSKTTPADFFLHLGVIVTLYASIISLISLLFLTINYAFPDLLNIYYSYQDPYSSGLKAAVATLIVIFPIFLVLSRLLAARESGIPEKRELPIRKWLIYVTLFLAGIAVVVDLIVLIKYFLEGDTPARFLLKVLAVLVVSGIAFSYYVYELRKSFVEMSAKRKLYSWITIVLVLGSLVWAFALMGSPATARALRFDSIRIDNLNDLNGRITTYWQMNQELPQKLTDVENSALGYILPKDPQTDELYEYKVLGDKRYELCAVFVRESDKSNPSAYPRYFGDETVWTHGVGRKCFEKEINPKLTQPIKDGVPVVPAKY